MGLQECFGCLSDFLLLHVVKVVNVDLLIIAFEIDQACLSFDVDSFFGVCLDGDRANGKLVSGVFFVSFLDGLVDCFELHLHESFEFGWRLFGIFSETIVDGRVASTEVFELAFVAFYFLLFVF